MWHDGLTPLCEGLDPFEEKFLLLGGGDGSGPGGDGGEGSDADGPGVGSGAESGGAPGSGGEADAGDADSGVGGGGEGSGPSGISGFFSDMFTPNQANINNAITKGLISAGLNIAGISNPLGLTAMGTMALGKAAIGALSEPGEPAGHPGLSDTSAANTSGMAGPTGLGPGFGGSEGGSDYLYKPILQAPQAAPTLLNPVPSAMRPQYEFKRNWWEGNKFVPAPITRIN